MPSYVPRVRGRFAGCAVDFAHCVGFEPEAYAIVSGSLIAGRAVSGCTRQFCRRRYLRDPDSLSSPNLPFGLGKLVQMTRPPSQRDAMREFYRQSGGDEVQTVAAYAAAERRVTSGRADAECVGVTCDTSCASGLAASVDAGGAECP